MKAVTIRQPFAWAIAAGFKDVENRSWAPRIDPGDIIAVHAAVAAPDLDDVRRVQKLVGRHATVPEEYDCGAIVAVARVAKVVTSSRSAWFSGPLGWILEDVVAVREPIECKGQLGLWNIPAGVETRLKRQLRSRRVRSARSA
jgi:hypothetical protein